MRKRLFKSVHKVIPVFEIEEKITNQPVKSSKDICIILQNIFEIEDLDVFGREYFMVLGLSRSNRVVFYEQISQGGISCVQVQPGFVFRPLITHNVSAFIIVHNHPSGRKSPSNADIQITKRISDGAKLMDLSFLDHIILCPNVEEKDWSYYSFCDEGQLF